MHRVTAEFVNIDSPRFVTLDLDAGTPAFTLDDIDEGFRYPIPEGAIVRVRYTATAEQQRRVDTAAIRGVLLASGAAVVKIVPDIVREDRARVGGVDESLAPLAALELFLAANSIDPELAERMRERTAHYLETVA